MPEISRFYGIVIKMYFGDHQPPHFHAEYGERRVRLLADGPGSPIDISTVIDTSQGIPTWVAACCGR